MNDETATELKSGKPVASAVAKAPAKEAEPPPDRHVVGVTEDRWQLKEHRNPGGWCCVPAKTTLDDLLMPAFWANVARHLRPNTTIEVHWDDSSMFAELYVLSSGRNWASIAMLRHHALAKAVLPKQAQRFDISYSGPVDKFRVVRLGDNAVIKTGFESNATAQRWLDEYLRKLAA